MAFHNDLGAKGERIAQEYLISKGYEIRAVNYRHRKAEIDIIALHENFLIVVEVKTRTAPTIVPLIQLVPPSKINHLIRATVLSLHLPQTPETIGLVNTHFISNFKNPFWLLNTGRGSAVVTADLVKAIEKGQIKGAGLDVLEYETSSFESFLNDTNKPEALRYLMESKKVILSPHVAGWTHESHEKLAKTVVEKIAVHFGMSS